MADWLVEDGIGEERAIRIEGDRIVAAKVTWPGELAAGAVVTAKLVSRTTGARRGTARLDDGTDVLVDKLPRDAAEGGPITLEVVRAAIGEAGRRKLAQARPSTKTPCPAPTLAERLRDAGETARTVRRFPGTDWEELWAEAADGRIAFAGGAIVLSPTPAMTLIDIDGTLPPRALALAAVPVIADAIARFDIGGSVGIDFPTLSEKADRRAVDEALEQALSFLSHERTAMNGFGFVQVVSRLSGPSLLQRIGADRSGAAARLLLRRAESITDPGVLLLTCHPSVEKALRPQWLEDLSRRTGRQLRIVTDPTLAPEAGFAQAALS
ncbi:ribonuclease [Croceicoccus bisphenolivorans]|uniref:ribonuclease n=1 Tax=Croceicoccus bisphenolivorans TaxID=1783232 RepID=UPI00082F8524|nr:ribonuclease [Croceicoccus bisphenolivorans]